MVEKKVLMKIIQEYVEKGGGVKRASKEVDTLAQKQKSLGRLSRKVNLDVGRLSKGISMQGVTWSKAGYWVDAAGRKIKNYNEMARKARMMTRRFNMELLSIMFGAMMFKRAITGIFKATTMTFKKIMEASEIQGTALQKLAFYWEYLKFEVGRTINEALEPFLPIIKKIVDWFGELIQKHPEEVFWGLAGSLAAFNALFAVGSFGLFIGGLSLAADKLGILAGAKTSLGGALGAAAHFVFWLLLIYGLVNMIGYFFPNIGEKVKQGFINMWEGLTSFNFVQFFAGFGQVLLGFAEATIRTIYKLITKILDLLIISSIERLSDLVGPVLRLVGLGDLADKLGGVAAELRGGITAGEEGISTTFDQWHIGIQDFIESSKEAKEAGADLSLGVDNLWKGPFGALTSTLQEDVIPSLLDLVGPMEEINPQIMAISDGFKEATDKANKTGKAFGKGSEINDGMIDLATTMNTTLDPQIDNTTKKLDGLNKQGERMTGWIGTVVGWIKGIFGGGQTQGNFQFGGYVPRSGLYRLHAGETVVPTNQNFGGITINVSGATGDVRTMATAISEELMREIRRRTHTNII